MNQSVMFRARGFPAKVSLRVLIRPEGSEGFSIGSNLPETFRTNGTGRATIEFVFPESYQTCIAEQGCFDTPWTQGSGAQVVLASNSARKPGEAVRFVIVNGPTPIA